MGFRLKEFVWLKLTYFLITYLTYFLITGLIKLNNNMKHRKVIHSLTLTSLSIVYERKHVVPEDIHNPPTELEGFFRPIYMVRLCHIQQAYDKLTTGL